MARLLSTTCNEIHPSNGSSSRLKVLQTCSMLLAQWRFRRMYLLLLGRHLSSFSSEEATSLRRTIGLFPSLPPAIKTWLVTPARLVRLTSTGKEVLHTNLQIRHQGLSACDILRRWTPQLEGSSAEFMYSARGAVSEGAGGGGYP